MTALQAILPQHLLSRLVGRLAQLEQPVWLKNALIRAFMSRYEIDLTEATCSSAEDFPHFNAFFTRSLREGMRPLAASQWCHPADGVLSQRGAIAASELLQAKGRTYSVQQLLAGSGLNTRLKHQTDEVKRLPVVKQRRRTAEIDSSAATEGAARGD